MERQRHADGLAAYPVDDASRLSLLRGKTIVHRARPSGAGPQIIATIAASCVLSSLRCLRPGLARSVNAASMPSARYLFPTRDTSRGYPPTSLAVSRTEMPSSNFRSVRIRRHRRAVICAPLTASFFSVRLSSSASSSPGNRLVAIIPSCRSTFTNKDKPFVIHKLRSKH
jgi:hypothetical protein